MQPCAIETESTSEMGKTDSSTMMDLSMKDIENLEKEKEGAFANILQESAKKEHYY